jgi:hypothetical protein
MLLPLLLFGFAALALTAAFGGEPRTFGRGHSCLLTRDARSSVP